MTEDEVRENEETAVEAEPEVTPTPEPVLEKGVFSLLQEVVGKGNVSNDELERVIYSGDPGGLPQYHYRWKSKYLSDFVVRVENSNQVEEVLKIAREHNIPVVPRGGASSCMCSSSPSRGGISLDIKTMNKILEINKEEMFIRIEPGVTFERLSSNLEKDGLTLGIYPSSAKSAVLGGWIGTGGRGGIGTPFYGSLRDHILSLSVIGGNGAVEVLEGDDIDLFHNSYGILGVVTEIKLKVHERPERYRTFSYGFRTVKGLSDALVEITALEAKPVYLKIADAELQKYSNPLETGNFVLSATYIDSSGNMPIDDLKEITGRHDGVYLTDEFSEKEWNLRYDAEFNPKEHTDTLMFQEYWVPVEKVYKMLSKYESYRRSHQLPALWFGMLGTHNEMRLELMVMINAEHYLKFIASKGILHKMMKRAIKLGGVPYTIGLQNSIYMSRAYPERMKEMIAAKEKWDPMGIMNPDRVTSCITSFRRIDFLFLLATAFRRLSRYVGE